MADIDEVAKRLAYLEREVRNDWKHLIDRLSRIEAQIDTFCESRGNDTGTQQKRQQDRWSGALWIIAWSIVTAAFTGTFVIALLTYMSP